jgi:predicted acetyltransferase
MTVEIRPITADELPRFRENLRTGFSSPPRPQDAERPEPIRPEWTLCAFEDGELATTYAALPFQMYFNGPAVSAAGVTAVSTLPWRRRRGHLRRIMETDFARMHEQDGPAIAILYASMAAIYQRFGFAVVSTAMQYRIEPRFIEFTRPEPERGRFRPFTRDGYACVEPVYEAFASPRPGYLKRDDLLWQHETFFYGPGAPVAVAYEEDGAIQGYVLYFAESRQGKTVTFGGNVQVWVQDFIWRTPAAYRALWGYLRRIDLAKQITIGRPPIDDPAPHLFLEPRMLNAISWDGLLARIVDVDRAMELRPYTGEGRLTFEITDDMAPWNSGRWEMETDGGGTRVRRTARAPELSMPVAALGPLLFGHLTASQGARIGLLTAHASEALPRWDALLRTGFPPGCGNGF